MINLATDNSLVVGHVYSEQIKGLIDTNYNLMAELDHRPIYTLDMTRQRLFSKVFPYI